jgi:hypothetical protein
VTTGFHREGNAHHVVLPWQGGLGLFRVQPPGVDFLASIPTENRAHGKLSQDGRHLIVLDRDGTRTRVFGLPQDGELEAPLTMPDLGPDARVDDVAMVGATVFAGGLGHEGAMAWTYDIRLPAPRWSELPMPGLPTWRDKSVDFLLVHGDDLIGVDDFRMPLYGIVWDIREPWSPEHMSTVTLPTHTTYERVKRAAVGTRYLALLSAGTNHGHASVHLSICCAHDLRERVAYSHWHDGDPATSSPHEALDQVCSMAFTGDVLLAATGERTLIRLDLRGPVLERPRNDGTFRRNHSPEGAPCLERLAVPGLCQAFHIAPAGAQGAVAMGLDARGQERAVWISMEQL